MKKNNDFLSDFSVSDDILYNFNPERYKFYVKFVEGLSEWAVRSPNEVYSLMQKGA